jgi:hypothetical protein
MPRYQDSGLHDSSEHSSEEIPAKKKKVITKKRISCEKEESKSNSRTNQKSKSKSDKISSKNSSDDRSSSNQEEITAASNRLKILNIDDQLSETTELSKIKFCIEWLNPESQFFKPWAAKANDCEHVYDKFCDKTYKIN